MSARFLKLADGTEIMLVDPWYVRRGRRESIGSMLDEIHAGWDRSFLEEELRELLWCSRFASWNELKQEAERAIEEGRLCWVDVREPVRPLDEVELVDLTDFEGAQDVDLGWLAIELVDQNGEPYADEAYQLRYSDGREFDLHLNAEGRAGFEDVPPGTYRVEFPKLRTSGAAADEILTLEDESPDTPGPEILMVDLQGLPSNQASLQIQIQIQSERFQTIEEAEDAVAELIDAIARVVEETRERELRDNDETIEELSEQLKKLRRVGKVFRHDAIVEAEKNLQLARDARKSLVASGKGEEFGVNIIRDGAEFRVGPLQRGGDRAVWIPDEVNTVSQLHSHRYDKTHDKAAAKRGGGPLAVYQSEQNWLTADLRDFQSDKERHGTPLRQAILFQRSEVLPRNGPVIAVFDQTSKTNPDGDILPSNVRFARIRRDRTQEARRYLQEHPKGRVP